MRRRWAIVILALTHLGVAGLVAITVAGGRARERFRAFAADPMYRIGLQLAGVKQHVDGLSDASFDADVELVARGHAGPLADVVQLMKHLNETAEGGASQYAEAARICAALGWRRCDHERLVAMRKAIGP
jgi:hypothetical protein